MTWVSFGYSITVAGFLITTTRRVVWLATVLWFPWFLFTSSSGLDPGEQAKVSTALDTAQFAINAIDEENKA